MWPICKKIEEPYVHGEIAAGIRRGSAKITIHENNIVNGHPRFWNQFMRVNEGFSTIAWISNKMDLPPRETRKLFSC